MKNLLNSTDKDITGSNALSSAEPRIAVNAILFNEENKIALIYMGGFDIHTLPGGGVDPGEDLIDAIKREVREETGYQCEVLGELGMVSENRGEGDTTQKRYYYFASTIGEPGELQLTDFEISENISVQWYTLEQALQIISDSKPKAYKEKFIQRRDIAVLEEAIKCRCM